MTTRATVTSKDAAWLLALARARVKKQQRRLDNYEIRNGDDTDHYDVLAVNLTWMEDATERLAALFTETVTGFDERTGATSEEAA